MGIISTPPLYLYMALYIIIKRLRKTILVVKLTPREESGDQCGDCGRATFMEFDRIKHKYTTCEMASEENQKELFSKIKMEEAGREKEDRIRLAIFHKKIKEDPGYMEKLLQKNRED